MFGKSKVWAVVALVTIMSLLGVTAAMAQTTAPASPLGPMSAETGWVPLGPGQSHWYSFFSTTALSNATNSQIQVELASQPQGSAGFTVWTPEGLRQVAAGITGNVGQPLGHGTVQTLGSGVTAWTLNGGDLLWLGKSLNAQQYQIQVTSNASTPITYNLIVSGAYVVYPSGTLTSQAQNQGKPMEMAQASQPAMASKPVAMTTSSTATNLPAPQILPSTGSQASPALGMSPSMAFAINNSQVHQLNPGGSQWFVLQYPGQLKGGFIPEGTLELIATPQGSANFTVWTAEGIRQTNAGITGNVGEPAGHGSMHPFTDGGVTFDRYDGNPAWTNKSGTATTFYIQVQPTGNMPSSYQLQYTQQ